LRDAVYSMAKPAAAPTATKTISLLKSMTLAAPTKADGDGVATVPLWVATGAPVEATLGAVVTAWIWPSEIWATGVTETLGAVVTAWIWPSEIWATGVTETLGAVVTACTWPSEIWATGVTETAWTWPSEIWLAWAATVAAKAKETTMFLMEGIVDDVVVIIM